MPLGAARRHRRPDRRWGKTGPPFAPRNAACRRHPADRLRRPRAGLYRWTDIGTAKATEERDGVADHGLDRRGGPATIADFAHARGPRGARRAADRAMAGGMVPACGRSSPGSTPTPFPRTRRSAEPRRISLVTGWTPSPHVWRRLRHDLAAATDLRNPRRSCARGRSRRSGRHAAASAGRLPGRGGVSSRSRSHRAPAPDHARARAQLDAGLVEEARVLRGARPGLAGVSAIGTGRAGRCSTARWTSRP